MGWMMPGREEEEDRGDEGGAWEEEEKDCHQWLSCEMIMLRVAVMLPIRPADDNAYARNNDNDAYIGKDDDNAYVVNKDNLLFYCGKLEYANF